MASLKGRAEREKTLTENMEDYLEVILELERKERVARVKDISNLLGVSRASVTEALRNLSRRGFVNHSRYGFVTLTEKGKGLASEIERKHGVIGLFLEQVLGIEPEKASETACRIEHVVDPEVMSRLVLFVERFRNCPRGGTFDWIENCRLARSPELEYETCKECLEECLQRVEERFLRRERETPLKSIRLSELEPGERGRIVKIGGPCEYRKRLAEMGLCRGTVIEVERVAPLGDPILVAVRGYRLSLRKDEARNIGVVKCIDALAPTDPGGKFLNNENKQ